MHLVLYSYHAFSDPSYTKNFPESADFSPFKHFNIPPMLSSFSKTAPFPPTVGIIVSSPSGSHDLLRNIENGSPAVLYEKGMKEKFVTYYPSSPTQDPYK